MRKCLSGRPHSITHKYIQEWAVNKYSLKRMSLTHECPFEKGTVLDLVLRANTAAPGIHSTVSAHQCPVHHLEFSAYYWPLCPSTAHPCSSYSLYTSGCLWRSQVQPAFQRPPSRLLLAPTVPSLSCLLSLSFRGVAASSSWCCCPLYIHPSCHTPGN